jgi:hypothetical protein
MSIQFSYTTPSTGAVADYHVVQQIGLDYISNNTNVQVASYVSKDAYEAGKFPVYTQNIQIAGLPVVTADPLVTVQNNLMAAAPTDGTASTTPNRYLFAGATLAD